MRHRHYHHWFFDLWVGAWLVSQGALRLLFWCLVAGGVPAFAFTDHPLEAFGLATAAVFVVIMWWASRPAPVELRGHGHVVVERVHCRNRR